MRRVVAAVVLCALSIPVLAADASERKFIGKGMTESEVLVRIGKPDNESEISGGGAKIVEKVWTYFPHDDDKQTMTTITIKSGRVVAVERTISR
ncbi:MAG TPA: hypothetical protein PKC97_12925 [Burkholderiaceae bacterium]|jgi:hypothetical protein|nr:hypothetical protein [Burkholderiaceae bacterium]